MATSIKDEIRQQAENDLEVFIRLIHTNRLLGNIHREVIKWWTRQDAKTHQLLLLPRDHQKSALLAYRIAWEITRNPSVRVLYLSATSTLAVKQLKFIKDILTSKVYRFYWPEMVSPDEAKREKWTETEISVDHPKRKEDNIRDSTIFTAGLTTTITGLHCDIVALDDIVVADNARDDAGRSKVKEQVSYLSSILSADGKVYVVGTHYHPLDLYMDFKQIHIDLFDEDGNVIEQQSLYEVFERKVEEDGQFLWPRTQDPKTGNWFGFNANILAKKKAQYFDLSNFMAQYYNDPNTSDTSVFSRDLFQYYDKKYLSKKDGKWYYKNNRLNVFAAIDFAYTLNKKSDYTCLITVGIDANNSIYILEIDRFKTNKISDFFEAILKAHVKWDFRKIRTEITAAQSMIVEDLKTNYIKVHGLALSIDEHRPTKKKELRIEDILQPRYNNKQMWHYQGGNCELLEEELLLARPPHDDIKDALTACLEIAIPPTFMGMGKTTTKTTPVFNKRFGGVG